MLPKTPSVECRPIQITTWICSLATWLLTLTVATGLLPASAHAQSAAGDLTYQREDLDFILQQIEFAERHAAGERLQDILPNYDAPLGLRTVDGSLNNLSPGMEHFGQADLPFPTNGTRVFPDADAGTSYASETHVIDASPRMISHLIVNQSTENPAAVLAAAEEEGENIGPDLAGSGQFFIPNTAPDEGLSAPINAYLTFFGQFFDHGLDLVEKGDNGMVLMDIPTDDPLFDPNCVDTIPPSGPPCNKMIMTRAKQFTAENGERTFINRTTPHVDQQQTYASHTSAQILLRSYQLGTNGQRNAIAILEADAAGAQSSAATAAQTAADANAAVTAAINGQEIENVLQAQAAADNNGRVRADFVLQADLPNQATRVEVRRANGVVFQCESRGGGEFHCDTPPGGAAPGLCFPFTPAQYRAPLREGEGVPLGTGPRITIPALYQPGLLGAAPAAEMAFSHLGESGYLYTR